MINREIPCKTCITLSICKARVKSYIETHNHPPSIILGIPHIDRCPLVKDHVHNNRNDIGDDAGDYIKESVRLYEILYNYLSDLED